MNARTILLVEDNEDDIELTVRAFSKCNVANEVVVARDGAQALDYLFGRGEYQDRDPTDTPAVLLLDLKLPRMDGLEVLRAIRANSLTELLPVVVLTSSREEQDIVESYQLGANSYVRKPVNFEQFLEAVRQLQLYWLLLNEAPPPQRSPS